MQQNLFGQPLQPPEPSRPSFHRARSNSLYPLPDGSIYFSAWTTYSDPPLDEGCLLDGTPMASTGEDLPPPYFGTGHRGGPFSPVDQRLLDVVAADPAVTTRAWPAHLREEFLEWHPGLARRFDMLAEAGARWEAWHGEAGFNGNGFECRITHRPSGRQTAFTLSPRVLPHLQELVSEAKRQFTPNHYRSRLLQVPKRYVAVAKARHADLVRRIEALQLGPVPDFLRDNHGTQAVFQDFRGHALPGHRAHQAWLWRTQGKLDVPDDLVDEAARNSLATSIEGSIQGVEAVLPILEAILSWAAHPTPDRFHNLREITSAQEELFAAQRGLHSMQADGLADARIAACLAAIDRLLSLPASSLADRHAIEVDHVLRTLESGPTVSIDDEDCDDGLAESDDSEE